MQDEAAEMLFIPSYTPEYSPIENWFSHLKRVVSEADYTTYRQLAQAITDRGFDLRSYIAESCFKHCLNEMKKFVHDTDFSELFPAINLHDNE